MAAAAHEAPEEPEARRHRLDAWAWGLLALLMGLAVSADLGYRQRQRALDASQQQFEGTAERVESALRRQLEDCRQLARAIQSLYLASDVVTPGEFLHAFDNLDARKRLPSLQALSIADAVATGSETRYVVSIVVPDQADNRRLLGFDIGTQPASRAAAELSRDSNEVVMSPPLRLRQATGQDQRAGVVLRLPVFSQGRVPTSRDERRARMRGSLGASFMLDALIAGAIDAAAVDKRLDIAVFDITDGNATHLYRVGPRLHAAGPDVLATRREIDFGHRTWQLRLAAKRSAEAAVPAWMRTLLYGALTSLLLGALVWSLVDSRRRALERAKDVGVRYRGSEMRFRKLNELLPSLVLLVDRQSGMIRYANQLAREKLGLGHDDAPLASVASPDMLENLRRMERDSRCTDEALLPLTGQDRFWANVTASDIELDGRRKWLLVMTDVSEQRELTERLSYQASHDALTRLPNRQEFESRIRRLLQHESGDRHCLLFIDLDQFKLINDSSGHIVGDQLLVQLALLIRQELQSDDVLARLGGDEFGVLLPAVAGLPEAMRVAQRLRMEIDNHVFLWEGRSYNISASVGGALFTGGSISLNELLAQVDTACYTAKDAGRNRVHFYTDDEVEAKARRSEMDWAHRIRWALDESRMRLAYQEIRATNGADGLQGARVELLVRLQDEQGQLVLPGAFLPAAERYGLMPRIDRWVVETALANFDALHPSGAALQVCAINLSAGSVEDDQFAGYLLQAIERHGVDPRRLMFEITETAAVHDLMRASELVKRLRGMGCRVALDDFGAGMSSFGYLKHLDVDTIKIDGAFVVDIERGSVSHSIVRAITEIGHQHRMNVVAEWVSGPAQVALLAELGVDYLQGFGIHQPEMVRFQH